MRKSIVWIDARQQQNARKSQDFQSLTDALVNHALINNPLFSRQRFALFLNWKSVGESAKSIEDLAVVLTARARPQVSARHIENCTFMLSGTWPNHATTPRNSIAGQKRPQNNSAKF